VKQKASDKLQGLQRHHLNFIVVPGIPVYSHFTYYPLIVNILS
jgi:hypothetical protein